MLKLLVSLFKNHLVSVMNATYTVLPKKFLKIRFYYLCFGYIHFYSVFKALANRRQFLPFPDWIQMNQVPWQCLWNPRIKLKYYYIIRLYFNSFFNSCQFIKLNIMLMKLYLFTFPSHLYSNLLLTRFTGNTKFEQFLIHVFYI